jgi:hypothetical protein
MKRSYDTGQAEDVGFFIGTEIERTPAYGMRTLFVVGVHSQIEILDIVKDSESYLDQSKHITHIYFGANQSFPQLDVNDPIGWSPWEDMISRLLGAGYWCTLDLDVAQAEGLLESSLIEYRRFIPQISVKLPYLQQLGYNATIKIDDKGFEASNPGVWCVPIGAITQRKYFTNWDEYSKDEIIK